MGSILIKNQKKTEKKVLANGSIIVCEIRYDDQCGNGYNSFGITADFYDNEKQFNRNNPSMCGCLHDEIKKHFPKLKNLIKWHSMNSNQPMYYIANSLYFAGNRDCWGLLKGEEKILSYSHYLEVNKSPFLYKLGKGLKEFIDTTGTNKKIWEEVQIEEIVYKNDKDNYNFSPKYCFKGMGINDWHKCPFDTKKEAKTFIEAMTLHDTKIVKKADMIRIGEGKERELEAFKSSACWYDATMETIEQDTEILKKQLEERLPKLIEEFKKDIEAIGFVY